MGEILTVFLLGQGLSIGFAAAGAYRAILLRKNTVTPALLIAATTVIGVPA